MLAEFRVANYRSFKDEQVLSLISSCAESAKNNSVAVGNYRILKTVAVYGANASGKSNLIKALSCMQEIIKESAGYKPGEKLPVAPFLFDDETSTQPSSFEATFFIDGVRYQYGFTATTQKIHDEWLYVYPSSQPQRWFEREIDDKTGESKIKFGTFLKGGKASIWTKVKNNSLFLSVAAQWNHKQLADVYKWICSRLRELPNPAVGKHLTDEMLYDARQDPQGKDVYEEMITILRQADLGISGIDIDRATIEQLKIPEEFPNEIQEQIIERFGKNPPFLTKAHHRFRDNAKEYLLPFDEESDGTRKFYSYLAPLLKSMAFGYTLFEDELDSSLHPLLVRNLLEAIRISEHDEISAQLIFTTHDTTLLDPELFGRDQVWFTEKDECGATKLYSLADYKEKPRKGEAMQKKYLAGRYGAIPIIERFDLSGAKE